MSPLMLVAAAVLGFQSVAASKAPPLPSSSPASNAPPMSSRAAPMRSTEGAARGFTLGDRPDAAQCRNLLRRAQLVPALRRVRDYSYCAALTSPPK